MNRDCWQRQPCWDPIWSADLSSCQPGHLITSIILSLQTGVVAVVYCFSSQAGQLMVLCHGGSLDLGIRCKVSLHFIINVFTTNSSSPPVSSRSHCLLSQFSLLCLHTSHLLQGEVQGELWYLQVLAQYCLSCRGVRMRFSKTICCLLSSDGMGVLMETQGQGGCTNLQLVISQFLR